jgi:hypothetical protein
MAMNYGFQELKSKVVYIGKQQVINEYWTMQVQGCWNMTKDTFQPGFEHILALSEEALSLGVQESGYK